MDRIAMLLIAGAGLACIYVGYRLFCGLPAISRGGPQVSRSSVFLMNVVPGALLALVGSGLLTAEARSVLSHRPVVRHHIPAAAAWHRGRMDFRSRAA
jgi:hypothetical protein